MTERRALDGSLLGQVRLMVLALGLVVAASPGSAQLCGDDGDCSGDDACIAGRCMPLVVDLNAYAAQAALNPASYWRSIQLPALFDPVEECCFDLDGDGTVDDAWGSLLALMMGLLGDLDPQADLDASVQDGTTTLIAEWRALPAGLADGDVQLSVFDGRWANGQTFPDMAAGQGAAWLDVASFGTHGSRYQYNTATLGSGWIEASGTGIPFPLQLMGEIDGRIDLVDAQIEAPLSISEPSCQGVCTVDEVRAGAVPENVGGGKLGGLVLFDDYMTLMNTSYQQCSCAGIDPEQDVFVWSPNQATGSYDVSCTDNTGIPENCVDYCANLPSICSFISGMALTLDIDRDTDGVEDAWSVGLRFGLSGTEILGLEDVFADGFESGDSSAWAATVGDI